jgi:hypothetical protein
MTDTIAIHIRLRFVDEFTLHLLIQRPNGRL